jgi:hypothetical protein
VPAAHEAVRHAGQQPEHLDPQHVTGCGAVDRDRAGDHVRPVEVVVVRNVGRGQVARVSEHAIGADAVTGQERDRVAALVFEDAFVTERVDRHGVAGRDAQHRLVRPVRQPTPAAGVGCGL